MGTETLDTAPPTTRIDPPNALETCDRCGATALWRVTYPVSDLLFCGHHGRAYGFAGTDSHAAYQSAQGKPKAKAEYKGKHEKKGK